LKDKTHFTFYIESTGIYKSVDIFRESIKLLQNKLNVKNKNGLNNKSFSDNNFENKRNKSLKTFENNYNNSLGENN